MAENDARLSSEHRAMLESELKLKAELKLASEAEIQKDSIEHNKLAIMNEEQQLEKKSAQITA